MCLTEAEITSCSRSFLRKNGFSIVSTSKGEKLFYRIEETERPELKQPDTVAIKDNYVIIFENKKLYNDLFKSGKDKISDVKKLRKFINNNAFVDEFKEKIKNLINPEYKTIHIKYGCSSLINKTSTYKLPDDFIFIGVLKKKKQILVSIEKTATLNDLFPIKSCVERL